MLTPLQEHVAAIIAGLTEAEGFALAGGAALIARGDVQRQTRDLDFFGPTPDAGISTTSARALLERFGSVAGVVAADPAGWLSVPGIGPERARALQETFTLRRNAPAPALER